MDTHDPPLSPRPGRSLLSFESVVCEEKLSRRESGFQESFPGRILGQVKEMHGGGKRWLKERVGSIFVFATGLDFRIWNLNRQIGFRSLIADWTKMKRNGTPLEAGWVYLGGARGIIYWEAGPHTGGDGAASPLFSTAQPGIAGRARSIFCQHSISYEIHSVTPLGDIKIELYVKNDAEWYSRCSRIIIFKKVCKKSKNRKTKISRKNAFHHF